ncbi:MAG: glycosyltransferase family 2 protein [Meiothermus sp.]|nr:glycosyltransferase family 2 protein [Meiothermus sp.]
MTGQPKIGLVTVTYNSAKVIPGFMESLQAQTYANWQLIAVDNQSKDSSAELLRSYDDDRVTIIFNEDNIGVAAGNNQGIREAIQQDCKYIVLINNDTEFPANLLAEMLRRLLELQCDMVVPKMYYYQPKDRLWFAGGKFRRFLFWQIRHIGLDQNDTGLFNQTVPIDYAPTCCVLMPSQLFEQVGLMDEQYFVYYDDVDFFLRANRKGCKTYYLPHIHLYHKVSSLSGGNESEWGLYMQSRNAILFLRKNYPALPQKLGLVGQQLFLLFRFILKRDNAKTFAIRQRGLRDGLRMPINRMPINS